MAEEENICRFCFEKAESENPLIDPCNCIGSTKYVHVVCLRKWRLHTTNNEWTNKCQLCLSDYALYLRWQKEQLPILTNSLYILVEKHYAVTIILYYLHLAFLSFYPSIYKTIIPTFGVLTPFDISTGIYFELQSLYFTQLSYEVYICLLLAVTFIYIKTYYYSFWKYIHNKRIYLSFWLSFVTDDGLFETPLMTVFMFILSAVLATHFIIPFAFFYIYMLSSIYYIHLTIIRHMNTDAEIF
jgi:hypothetical protein